MVKKILCIVLWVITGVALVVLFAFGRKGYLETPLKGIAFQLERPEAKGFVEKDSVIAHIEDICGLERHATIASIDMMKIQKLLTSSPWIESASAYIGLNDTLIVTAKEHCPVLRVYNQKGQSVYVTEDGAVIPSSPIYTPRMIIASGRYDFPTGKSGSSLADSIYATSGISETLAIVMALRNDPFLSGNVGQIYKNANNEYELMVNNVSASVLLGDTCAVNHKLSRLHTLLEKYSGTETLNDYKTLDLRYKNQIVCTKK
ncbi:MAG: hypothetical protein IKT08_09555 [Bacteroidales bacterium]|nr:hypothetical protein [Bacteroidales bacterium]